MSDGDRLHILERKVTELRQAASTGEYGVSVLVSEIADLYDDRDAFIEWVQDEFRLTLPAARSFVTRRRAWASLPDTDRVRALGPTRGYRVGRAWKRSTDETTTLEALLDDEEALSAEDFEARYLDKTPLVEKPKCECTCPNCGRSILHEPKGA